MHHTLISYYFEDKKKLFEDVFARRAVVTSQRRVKALDDYAREVGESPTVEGARCGLSSTPTSISIPKAVRGGATMARWVPQVASTPEWGGG